MAPTAPIQAGLLSSGRALIINTIPPDISPAVCDTKSQRYHGIVRVASRPPLMFREWRPFICVLPHEISLASRASVDIVSGQLIPAVHTKYSCDLKCYLGMLIRYTSIGTRVTRKNSTLFSRRVPGIFLDPIHRRLTRSTNQAGNKPSQTPRKPVHHRAHEPINLDQSTFFQGSLPSQSYSSPSSSMITGNDSNTTSFRS